MSAAKNRQRARVRGIRGAVLLAALACCGAVAAEPAAVESRPLPARTPSEGPRFKTLPPAQTGIAAVNEYGDPRMWGERYAEFAFGSLGTGVAIGDYDGDDRPDVFVVTKFGPSRLYRNLGDWRFADVTEQTGVAFAGDAWGQGASFADVNNDGWLDLYVCRHAAPNLLFVNQGDGTFVERGAQAGLALADASVVGAFHDYDRDGWLDVYVPTNLLDNEQGPQGQRDRLYRNRGGWFEEATDAARLFGQTQGHSATWWDYNEDGWPDLYVANDFVTPDQLYHNRGDGIFVNVIDAAVPNFPFFAMGADLGDVNNDGRLDLLVADMLPTRREQNVRGMLNMQVTMARDLPAAAAGQHMRTMLYVSTGTGRYLEAGFLAGVAATDWTWSPRFEDLDEDGRVDLHISNGMVRDFLDHDLIARMANQSFDQRRRLVRGAPELREHNFAFRNLGGLRFDEVGRDWGLDHHGISFGSAFGDLDGDGDLDLVIANYNAPPTVCRNDSAEHHRVVLALRGTRSNRFGIGARVRLESASGVQVRQLNVVRGYASTSEPILHFGLGSDTNVQRLTIRWPSGVEQTLENLAVDRRYTVHEPADGAVAQPRRDSPTQFKEAAAAIGFPPGSIETPVDEFAAQPLLPARKQSFGPGLALGDLDGDERDDLVLGGVAGAPMQVLVNIGGRLLPGGNPVVGRSPALADAAPLILDVNRDGLADLFVPKGGVSAPAGDSAYQPRLLLGTGSGFFREAAADVLPPMPVSAGPAVAADWNRDGWPDVFVGGRVVPGAYPQTPRSVLLTNRSGQLSDDTEEVAPGLAASGLVNAALWSDVDDDGWIDLLVAIEWGAIRCWRNVSGMRFEEATESLGFADAGRGWWQSLAAADFNGDGRMDYIVGNVGLNTRYRASPEAPLALVRAPLVDGGQPQLVEGETIDGRLVPIRGRNAVTATTPALLKRLPTFAAYAALSVEELVGAGRMRDAGTWTATELRHGVFLSEGGGCRFVPLPHEAQIAPAFGIAAGDFDGDGAADVFLVQNSHAPNPEVGRFSGGASTFLRGDGRGGFIVASIADTGLLVPGEARALAVADVNGDGWPDFLVTCRGTRNLAFLNRPVAGRRSLAVRLTTGSTHAPIAGARVTVTLASGRTRTAEYHLGGGYLSQSAPEQYFGFEEQDPPAKLHVRWPHGGTTTQPLDGRTSRVIVRALARDVEAVSEEFRARFGRALER